MRMAVGFSKGGGVLGKLVIWMNVVWKVALRWMGRRISLERVCRVHDLFPAKRSKRGREFGVR